MAKKVKLYGLRRYWPALTQQQAEGERAALALRQNNCCALCGRHESSFKRRLNVDHNHKTGQVRGLLCYRCNKFIVGRHTLDSALKLVNYLRIEEQRRKK